MARQPSGPLIDVGRNGAAGLAFIAHSPTSMGYGGGNGHPRRTRLVVEGLRGGTTTGAGQGSTTGARGPDPPGAAWGPARVPYIRRVSRLADAARERERAGAKQGQLLPPLPPPHGWHGRCERRGKQVEEAAQNIRLVHVCVPAADEACDGGSVALSAVVARARSGTARAREQETGGNSHGHRNFPDHISRLFVGDFASCCRDAHA